MNPGADRGPRSGRRGVTETMVSWNTSSTGRPVSASMPEHCSGAMFYTQVWHIGRSRKCMAQRARDSCAKRGIRHWRPAGGTGYKRRVHWTAQRGWKISGEVVLPAAQFCMGIFPCSGCQGCSRAVSHAPLQSRLGLGRHGARDQMGIHTSTTNTTTLRLRELFVSRGCLYPLQGGLFPDTLRSG